jgi:RimJ/RimL family protein N-acetyltransferase
MTSTDELATLYPPFGLTLRTGDLTLRMLRDADLSEYAELLRRPIFEDEDAPYVFGWYRVDPAQRVAGALSFQWRLRAELGAEEWTLPLGIWADGRLVGAQDLAATRFAERRTVRSGSWLTRDAHGNGWGKLMRQAVLVLAFDHLGAVRAESAAGVDNAASAAVSHGCGYVDDGTQVSTLPGMNGLERRFRATPESFRRPEVPVEVEGLTAELREMLGARTGESLSA